MLWKSVAGAAVGTLLACGGAMAQSRCSVMDPTGTPLNVRSAPNGRIVDQLPNGMLVAIIEVTRDRSGRPWAYVRDRNEVTPIGWVYREFIACY